MRIKRLPIGRYESDFKQYDLAFRTSCLVLRDYRNSAPGAVSIVDGRLTRANVADVDFRESEVRIPDVRDSGLFHAVCHIDEDHRDEVDFYEPLPEGDRQGEEHSKMVAIQVSTAGRVKPAHKVTAEVVWLSMFDRGAYTRVNEWLPEFMDLDFETAQAIAGAPNRESLSEDVQRRYSHLLDITHPGDPTVELAFRLLCEARLACGEAESSVIGLVEVRAPVALDSWLEPFEPKGKDQSERIAAVVAMMGSEEAKESASAVLDAVQRNEDVLVKAKEFPGVSADHGESEDCLEGGAQ